MYPDLNNDQTRPEVFKNLALRQPEPPRNMVNLENILLLERKISQIVDFIENKYKDCVSSDSPNELVKICEDWWDISDNETMLPNLGNVFKEQRYKAILRTTSIVEACILTTIHLISGHIQVPPKSILQGKLNKMPNENNLTT